jgi:hypothetical protein
MKIYGMSLIWAGSISLDSTFNPLTLKTCHCPAKKEGSQEVYQWIRRFASTSYTVHIADVFSKGYNRALSLKKPVERLGPKKGGVFYLCRVRYQKLRGA